MAGRTCSQCSADRVLFSSNYKYFARFLYVGNRGHNSIAVFRVDQSTGTLSLVDIQDSHGAFPRHFNFDRTSQFLVVGNHASDNIVGKGPFTNDVHQ